MKRLILCLIALCVIGNYSQAQTIEIENYNYNDDSAKIYTAGYASLNPIASKFLEISIGAQQQFYLRQKVDQVFRNTLSELFKCDIYIWSSGGIYVELGNNENYHPNPGSL